MTETVPTPPDAIPPASAPLRIALLGEWHPEVIAHRAIPRALLDAAEAAGCGLSLQWLASDALGDVAARLAGFDGLWCVPGSPYRSLDGVLAAIGEVRRTGLPFLGSCGGFQHAVLEHARTDLGWSDAQHAETAPDAAQPVIAPLACGLVEARREILFAPGSRIAAAYGRPSAAEAYRCRYGVVPALREALFSGALQATGLAAPGPDGQEPAVAVHAVERTDHPFFVATLFQSERAALRGERVPLAEAFVAACLDRRAKTE